LTSGEGDGYSVRMNCSGRVSRALIALVLVGVLSAAASGHATAVDQPTVVPAEDYPVMDAVVAAKFLTSQTRMVLVERLTTTRLQPDEDRLPSMALFTERDLFEGRLPADLIRDFVAKNQRPSKFEARFSFGVRYRFVAGDGTAESEASLPLLPVRRQSVDEPRNVDTIDRLAFSRVGFTIKADQALVYVSNERPDATGAGFLIWSVRRNSRWEVYDTDVIWVSHPDDASGAR